MQSNHPILTSYVKVKIYYIFFCGTNGTNGTSTLGLMVVVSAQSRSNLGFISALGVLIAIIGTCVTLLGKKLLGSIYSEVEY